LDLAAINLITAPMEARSQQLIVVANVSHRFKCKRMQARKKIERAVPRVVLVVDTVTRHPYSCSSQLSKKSRKQEGKERLDKQLMVCRIPMEQHEALGQDSQAATMAITSNRLMHFKTLISSRISFFKTTRISLTI
jgi:hypothetical protein